MKNITIIISNINKSLAFEWIAEKLNKESFNLSFILLNPGHSELEEYLKKQKITCITIPFKNKRQIPSCVIKVAKHLKKLKSEIVHTHLFEANIIGLTAAKLIGIKKRIYTRHHSTYHHTFHKKAVKYDNYINKKSTHIVAISEVVKNVLLKRENVPLEKITLIHHGFPLEQLTNPNNEIIDALKLKYNPSNKFPVIGVISRYTEWKGIQFIIPAFKKILTKYPNALLILANAGGDYQTTIHSQLNTLPAGSYQEIKFENHIFELYALFNVFVHTPIDSDIEAFGQIYIEALAAKIPSVFTISGIASEVIENNYNALVVDYNNSVPIEDSILKLIENKQLCETLTNNGLESIKKNFALETMITKLEELYEK